MLGVPFQQVVLFIDIRLTESARIKNGWSHGVTLHVGRYLQVFKALFKCIRPLEVCVTSPKQQKRPTSEEKPTGEPLHMSGVNYQGSIDSLVRNIGIISRNNSALASALASEGGAAKPGSTSAKELRLLLQDTGVLAKETGELLLSVQHDLKHERTPPRQQPMLAKLSKDFQFVLRRFQQLTEQSARQHQSSAEANAASGSSSGGYGGPHNLQDDEDEDEDEDVEATAGLLQHSQQQQQQSAAETARINAQRMEERAKIMTQTEQTLGEVREIFADLAGLVAEQTTRIDDIASSIENTASQSTRATEELKAAGRYHADRRARRFCMYFAALVCVALLILYLTYSLKTAS